LWYVATHLDRFKSLLNREDAVASRLDMGSHRQYVSDLEYNWQDDLNMGCCVVRKEDQAEKPIAVAIASASAYRADVRRLTELNWRRTNAYREREDQWCLDYLVRAREFRGRGVGCFALVGLMECFCSRFGDAVLWLSLAGGFSNRNTLSLYTDVGFFVMSLDSDKNPIMLLQVHDIGQRARRMLVDTLTLRYGAAAAEQSNFRSFNDKLRPSRSAGRKICINDIVNKMHFILNTWDSSYVIRKSMAKSGDKCSIGSLWIKFCNLT
jgi:GNAT superfamily N-acetyltransferase